MASPHPPLVPFLLVVVLVQNSNLMSKFSNIKNIKAEFRNSNKIVDTRGASRNILSDISARGIRNTKSNSRNIMADRAIVQTKSEMKSILEHLEAVASLLEDSQITPGQEEELEELEEEWQIYHYYLQWVSLEDQDKEQEWNFYQYYLDTIHRLSQLFRASILVGGGSVINGAYPV